MTTPDGPADTRMMGIVHAALKRDLRRTRDVLAAAPPPQGRQRAALARHVLWMLEFLHAHHAAEDAGLWPLVRTRNPAAAGLLAAMEEDHARIGPVAAAAETSAREYGATTGDAPRAALVADLGRLLEVLVPHLDREVEEAMPVVAASITDREWNVVEQQYNIKPKTTQQLAMEGHWLLEDIGAEGYEVVVHQVRPVQRFVLLHGFGRRYRRLAAERWMPDRAAARVQT